MGLFQTLPDKLLRRATDGESVEDRAVATLAIGRQVRSASLSEDDRRFARQLFMRIADDVAEEVRRALSVTLRSSPNLPRAVANRLIADIDSIAAPVLEHSPVVTDDDLISVLRSRAAAKVRAVASRPVVSERLSGAVISFGDGPAVAALAANDGALIAEADAARIVRLARDDDLIREAALRRADMPAALVVSLIGDKVDRLRDALTPRTPAAAQLADDVRSRAQASFATRDWSPHALRGFIDALHAKGGLDDATLARAAGQGDWRFVQCALAVLAGISEEKAGLMVLDSRPFALRALCKRAGLGESARTLLVVAANAYLDLSRRSVALDRRAFQRMMAERIASHPDADAHETLWMDWLDDGLSPRAA